MTPEENFRVLFDACKTAFGVFWLVYCILFHVLPCLYHFGIVCILLIPSAYCIVSGLGIYDDIVSYLYDHPAYQSVRRVYALFDVVYSAYASPALALTVETPSDVSELFYMAKPMITSLKIVLCAFLEPRDCASSLSTLRQKSLYKVCRAARRLHQMFDRSEQPTPPPTLQRADSEEFTLVEPEVPPVVPRELKIRILSLAASKGVTYGEYIDKHVPADFKTKYTF